jgi:hypothetical protein
MSAYEDGYTHGYNDRSEELEPRIEAQAALIAEYEAALEVWNAAWKTGRNEPMIIAYENSRAALAKAKAVQP